MCYSEFKPRLSGDLSLLPALSQARDYQASRSLTPIKQPVESIPKIADLFAIPTSPPCRVPRARRGGYGSDPFLRRPMGQRTYPLCPLVAGAVPHQRDGQKCRFVKCFENTRGNLITSTFPNTRTPTHKSSAPALMSFMLFMLFMVKICPKDSRNPNPRRPVSLFAFDFRFFFALCSTSRSVSNPPPHLCKSASLQQSKDTQKCSEIQTRMSPRGTFPKLIPHPSTRSLRFRNSRRIRHCPPP